MNRILTLLTFLLSLTALHAQDPQSTYQIMRLNTNSVSIGGRQLHQGDKFAGSDNITWADDKQSMEVKDVATGTLYRFSQKVFDSHGAVKSLSDFFLRTRKASTRDADDGIELWRSPVSKDFAERRLALVIGNSNYSNLSYLRNAQKDASDLASLLGALGFDVIQRYEADYDMMRTALNRFSALASDYDVVLFYFAGHGIQEDGKNYLIPVNAELEYRSELARLLSCEDVVDRMNVSNARVRLIFLDACRTPKKSWSRDITKGLANMEGAPGSVIMFSTQSGKEALDGEGDNSPFAASLIQNIAQPGHNVMETMNSVVRDTYLLTEKEQYPHMMGTDISGFVFNPGKKAVKTDVKAVPEKTKAKEQAKPSPQSTPSQSTSSQSASPQSAQQAEPKVKVGARGVSASITSPVRSGNNLDFNLMVINNTGKLLNPVILRGDLYLPDGTSRKLDYLRMEARVGQESARYAFSLPVGVPLAIRFRVNDVPENITMLSLLSLTFSGLDSYDPLSETLVQVRNVPIGDEQNADFKPAQAGEPSMTISTPGISATITKAVYAGTNLDFILTVTNKTSGDLRPTLTGQGSALYLPDGNVKKLDYIGFSASMSGNNPRYQFTMPAGVPMAIQFRAKDMPENITSLPLFRATFTGMDAASVFNETTIEVRNLPVVSD